MAGKNQVNMEIDDDKLKDHYSDIYNNLSQTGESKILDSMQKTIIDSYTKKIENEKGCYQIASTYIAEIMQSLKRNKKAGFSGISNEMIKVAPETNMTEEIKDLLETMINHGVCPDDLNTGVVVTLIKNKAASNTSIDNSRGITIGASHAQSLSISC